MKALRHSALCSPSVREITVKPSGADALTVAPSQRTTPSRVPLAKLAKKKRSRPTVGQGPPPQIPVEPVPHLPGVPDSAPAAAAPDPYAGREPVVSTDIDLDRDHGHETPYSERPPRREPMTRGRMTAEVMRPRPPEPKSNAVWFFVLVVAVALAGLVAWKMGVFKKQPVEEDDTYDDTPAELVE